MLFVYVEQQMLNNEVSLALKLKDIHTICDLLEGLLTL